MIDEAPDADVGSIGSFNILAWQLAGAVGVVTDGSARDTDEIATEEVPLYFREPGRGIRPWRNEVESVNRPVVVGGALVRPGRRHRRRRRSSRRKAALSCQVRLR